MAETSSYAGLLFIGDPHLCASPPGYRLDDYGRTILGKLAYCLEVAAQRQYLPVILGDLFHVPRNNPNHLLVDLLDLFRRPVPWVLVGNHDKHEARLTRDVSLWVLHAARVIRLLHQEGPAGTVEVGGLKVLLGASPDWTSLPKSVPRQEHDFVIWLSHHDLAFPGYEAGRQQLKEIPGVDLVVNGHIHTPKPPVRRGQTVWCNPGGISRVALSALTAKITPGAAFWQPGMEAPQPLAIPHRPFKEVFPPLPERVGASRSLDESRFIKGLENLMMRKTTEGLGLKAFLEANLDEGEPADRIIWELYKEVTSHAG